MSLTKKFKTTILLGNENNNSIQSAAIQSLTKFKKKIDLNPIITPFLLSDNEAIREYAKKALK